MCHGLPLFSGLLNQFRDQAGPACLMTCADAGSVVPMEVFVEYDVVTPVRIVLKGLRAAEHRTFPLSILEKDVRQTS